MKRHGSVITVAVTLGALVQLLLPSAAGSVASADDTGIPGQVIDSTRTSNTYANSDGSLTTEVFASSVNYRKGSGDFAPIDNELIPVPGPDPDMRNTANRYQIQLPPDILNPIQITRPAGSIYLTLLGAHGIQQVAGSTASYASALPGVDVAYTASGDSVAQIMTLHSADVPREFQYRMTLSDGLTAITGDDGSVNVQNASGGLVYSIPPPLMFDSAEGGEFFPVPVNLSLTGDAEGYLVTETLDSGWIDSPERVWPVIVDPDVTTSPAAAPDCWYQSGTSGVIQSCSSTGLNVGYNQNGRRHGVLQFAFPADFVGSTVESARLALTLLSDNNTKTISLELDPLTSDWTSGLNWGTRDAFQPWESVASDVGGDFATTPSVIVPGLGGTISSAVAVGTSDPATSPPSINIASIAQFWANGGEEDGLLLRQTNDQSASSGNILSFAASENAVQAYHPVLTVTYTPRTCSPQTPTTPTVDQSSLNPVLHAQYANTCGIGGHVQYQIYDDTETLVATVDGDSSANGVDSAAVLDEFVPIDDGQTYTVTARSTDGTAYSSSSSPATFTYYPNIVTNPSDELAPVASDIAISTDSTFDFASLAEEAASVPADNTTPAEAVAPEDEGDSGYTPVTSAPLMIGNSADGATSGIVIGSEPTITSTPPSTSAASCSLPECPAYRAAENLRIPPDPIAAVGGVVLDGTLHHQYAVTVESGVGVASNGGGITVVELTGSGEAGSGIVGRVPWCVALASVPSDCYVQHPAPNTLAAANYNDPQVVYDRIHGVWTIAVFARNGPHDTWLWLLWSVTSKQNPDPIGDWHVGHIDIVSTTGQTSLDAPRMAIGGKILAPGQGQDSSGDVALNITAQLDGNNPGPWLWAIHDVYGGAKFATVYRLTSNYETQDSSHATLGAADPVYMIGDNRGYSFVIAPFAGATNLVKVYYVTWHSAAGGWEAVVNGVNDDGIKASPYTMCSTVAQPGSQYPIEPSNRFQGAVWLRGELWVSRCAKDSENRDGIEVSQFRAVLKKNQTTQEVYDATTITQQKVLGVAGVNLILPTMTWNFDARVAVAFMLVNGSNPAYNPSTWYAGHDQSGWHFGNVWVGAPGNGPLQNHDSRDNARAGDYFGASPDPSNSNYVWMFGQSGSNVDHQVANGLLWLQRIEPSDYS